MSTVRTVAGAALVALVLGALTLMVWPASEADKAREDGEQLGEAVTQVYEADSESEMDAALAEVDEAVTDSLEHGGEAVAEQAARQDEALDLAVEGYVGAVESTDSFEQDVYETELDYALTELEYNADEFRSSSDDVVAAYWEGFDDGFDKE